MLTDEHIQKEKYYRNTRQLSSALTALCEMAIEVRAASSLEKLQAEIDRIQSVHEDRFAEADRAYVDAMKETRFIDADRAYADAVMALRRTEEAARRRTTGEEVLSRELSIPTETFARILSGEPRTPTLDDEAPS